MAAAYWNNRKAGGPSFGDLTVILIPDNCCAQQHVLYARAIHDLDTFLHEIIRHTAATVWDTLQQAQLPELAALHNVLVSWTQTPLQPLHIPPVLHLILLNLGRNRGQILGGHLPYNAISTPAGPHPSWGRKPDWLFTTAAFLCFQILNLTAANEVSLIPAFPLGFDHFISPILADDILHNRFSDWFQTDAPIFKPRDPIGRHNGYYSPSLAIDNKFEACTKNSVNCLHFKLSLLPHIVSAQLQERVDAQAVTAPALGTHWSLNIGKRIPPGTLPTHGFKKLADWSCARYRKVHHSPQHRLLAVQNQATTPGAWRQGLNNSPVARAQILGLSPVPICFP
jgi:hypothetical protein